ncbi:hypothetical protein C1645_839440 [Glomus cerebriforme]|uniref:Uncharacterized protein n=1 Tax=Glomus cerebriforme TaxID=658196 RepID=A0A397S5M1_9GLOM|nr:hypothetical protein C1645_839440 [Glomus cerebriforme]
MRPRAEKNKLIASKKAKTTNKNVNDDLFISSSLSSRKDVNSPIYDSLRKSHEGQDSLNIDISKIKEESECERISDKHDGILYLDIYGTKVGIQYIEVVGNTFTTNKSNKNDDLKKLLKATMISIWYQNVYTESNTTTLKLQSFAILMFGKYYTIFYARHPNLRINNLLIEWL